MTLKPKGQFTALAAYGQDDAMNKRLDLNHKKQFAAVTAGLTCCSSITPPWIINRSRPSAALGHNNQRPLKLYASHNCCRRQQFFRLLLLCPSSECDEWLGRAQLPIKLRLSPATGNDSNDITISRSVVTDVTWSSSAGNSKKTGRYVSYTISGVDETQAWIPWQS